MVKKLRFFPKSHKYKYGSQELESATKFISKFFEKFDDKKIARNLSKIPANKEAKRGVRYFLNKWRESRELGTRVHEAIYKSLSGIEDNYVNESEVELVINALDYLETFGITDFVETEKVIYDAELGLAGTIDIFLENNGKVLLIDWKTNEKLSTEGYKGKRGSTVVTSDMHDCHISKYGLQLSLYAYMLERQGYDIGELYIVHLTKEGAVPIQVAYLRKKIEEMLIFDGKLKSSVSVIDDSFDDMEGLLE